MLDMFIIGYGIGLCILLITVCIIGVISAFYIKDAEVRKELEKGLILFLSYLSFFGWLQWVSACAD
ncbi:MAG: hypothetical protein WCS21_10880 [Lachnospiraceae bacterium]